MFQGKSQGTPTSHPELASWWRASEDTGPAAVLGEEQLAAPTHSCSCFSHGNDHGLTFSSLQPAAVHTGKPSSHSPTRLGSVVKVTLSVTWPFINPFCQPHYLSQLAGSSHQEGVCKQNRAGPLQAENILKRPYTATQRGDPQNVIPEERVETMGDDLHVFL